MRRINWSLWLPYVFGCAVGGIGVLLVMSYNTGKMLEACKAETGAYECRVIATPVSVPGWVSNGLGK